MVKFLTSLFYVVLFVAIASDERIVPMVYGKVCVVDIGFNICSTLNDRCKKLCIQATFSYVHVATCQIRSDGSTFCECAYDCDDDKHIHQEKMKMSSPAPAPAPAPY
uniref:Defensin-like protein n=1 Tax=Nicotiana tabacum TaxID=4097 RepID=A0A1S4CFP2_TOBAC|nr:PREDICTED: uncharacterized protein LOC107770916 [Nicotiana tabacum]XP_016499958.1 PREDICTED: uncharacterized protein LOC107818448 [Nicotiana tabacum]